MRHKKREIKLGSDKDHSKALLVNLIKSLLFYEEILTTEIRAKETARVAEKMISLAKNGSLSHRRNAFKFIQDKKVVEKLFNVVASRYKEQNGGYTRVIRVGYRKGDNALMCKVKLV